jgi:Spy/CpxP family protein refolding chaperone
MKRTTQFFVVTLVVALGIAGEAFAQRGRGGFGGFGLANAATIAANEPVQKELGLSNDIASKLTAIRDDYRAAQQKEYQTAGIDFQNLTAESRQKMLDVGTKLNAEFDPKVKALVGADAYKRLQQIQLQYNVRNSGPAALTASDVAAELKLTDEQKQKLNEMLPEFSNKMRELFRGGGGGDADARRKLIAEFVTKSTDLLTTDQKEKLKSLQGSTFDVSQISFGGRRGKGN